MDENQIELYKTIKHKIQSFSATIYTIPLFVEKSFEILEELSSFVLSIIIKVHEFLKKQKLKNMNIADKNLTKQFKQNYSRIIDYIKELGKLCNQISIQITFDIVESFQKDCYRVLSIIYGLISKAIVYCQEMDIFKQRIFLIEKNEKCDSTITKCKICQIDMIFNHVKCIHFVPSCSKCIECDKMLTNIDLSMTNKEMDLLILYN